MIVSEFHHMRKALGKRVRVVLSREDNNAILTGVLRSISEDGEVCVVQKDGMGIYGWPALEMDVLEDERQHDPAKCFDTRHLREICPGCGGKLGPPMACTTHSEWTCLQCGVTLDSRVVLPVVVHEGLES